MKPQTQRTQASSRDGILDAAERLLARHGYRKATMDEIAREAGIGKGTTYLHFASKEDVFLGTIDRIVDRLCERLAVIGAEEAPLADRVERMLVERVLFRFDSVSSYPSSLDDLFAALRLKYFDRRAANFNREADVFASILASVDGLDAREAAETLLQATNGLLPYALSPAELGDRTDVARRATRVARALTHGTFPLSLCHHESGVEQ